MSQPRNSNNGCIEQILFLFDNISILKHSTLTIYLNLENFWCFLLSVVSHHFSAKHRCPALDILTWFLSNSKLKIQTLAKTDHTHTMFLPDEVSDYVAPADLEDAHQMAPIVSENGTAFCTFTQEGKHLLFVLI